MITKERVKELLDYDPLSGIFRWKDIPGKGHQAVRGKIAGCLNHSGYILLGLDRKLYCAHRIVFLLQTGKIPRCVDHINGIKNDNRWSNLRGATHQQNAYNHKGPGSTSGYKNVYVDKRGQKNFYVVIIVDGKQVRGGFFHTAEEANEAATLLREKHHGEFANHGCKNQTISV